MTSEFEKNLQKYADLTVSVGLNLQPGQRLLIGRPALGRAVPIQVAPLVRALTRSAYRQGARLVDVIWQDEELTLIRFQEAPRDSFHEYPDWQAQGLNDIVANQDAVLGIIANQPNLLKDQDPELISLVQRISDAKTKSALDALVSNRMNWSVISAATPNWAAKVFPDDSPEVGTAKLWDAIFDICRVKEADPVAAWQEHINQLQARGSYLNEKQYRSLHFRSKDTDLKIALIPGHVWRSGQLHSQSGIPFAPNLPTEEVFTIPDSRFTEGTVRSTKPLSYAGTLIEDFNLTFKEGTVVKASAAAGETALQQLLANDPGARRLGEVALVPHSSPIAQSDRLFYNSLIDENAASHVALGRAYQFCLTGGERLSEAAFSAHGGNLSLVHVDFMIGSGTMDVDAVTESGEREPLMRQGEWAFSL